MAHTSLQVCMDSSDHWLQGTMSEEVSTEVNHSSSSPSGGGSDCMLAVACSSQAGPPLMERRLRPPHDTNLKCPRCDSTHTKFCYYNNYSLSQPRYFCKTCRRYWTKGGTLRNIPVGGGCRKNKKASSKKSNDNLHLHQPLIQGGSNGVGTASSSPTDHLHLAFPELQFHPHLANLIGTQMSLGGANVMDTGLLRPIDFMESKYDFNRGDNGNGNHHDFGVLSGLEEHNAGINGGFIGISSANNYCNISPFGMSSNQNLHDCNNSNGIGFMDQRLLLPFDGRNDNLHHQNHQNVTDVKPNPKLLSLEWQDQGFSSNNVKDSSYGGGFNVNSWSGMMGGFQPSAANSLV